MLLFCMMLSCVVLHGEASSAPAGRLGLLVGQALQRVAPRREEGAAEEEERPEREVDSKDTEEPCKHHGYLWPPEESEHDDDPPPGQGQAGPGGAVHFWA